MNSTFKGCASPDDDTSGSAPTATDGDENPAGEDSSPSSAGFTGTA